MMDTYFDTDLMADIVRELEQCPTLKFPHNQRGKMLRNGTCPGASCGRKDAYINKQSPGAVKCGSEGKGCGQVYPVTELFPWLFENMSERYPATAENPNATADKFLSSRRRFDVSKLKDWYEQAAYIMPNGKPTPTVRVYLDEKRNFWERIIDDSALKVIDPKTGKPVPKGNFRGGYSYKNKGWQPPGQAIEKGDTVFIVEGIFHAMTFALAGRKVVVAWSCVNLPRDLIKQHTGQMITWCLAYDNDQAGNKYTENYCSELKRLGETFKVYLTESANVDWDDRLKNGKLNDEYLRQCEFRGELFTAKSAMQFAFLHYMEREQKMTYKLFEFNSRLYKVNIDIKELQDTLTENGTDHPALHDFTGNAKLDEISNCFPEFLYIEKDELTDEQKYFFNVEFSDTRTTCHAALEPSAVNDPRNFSNALLNKTSGGYFEGSAADMRTLRKKWLGSNVDYVEAINYVGYHIIHVR
ncbi:MAG: toprim domain-containing protein, partial [Pseudomonadales bacterium]|nr:toprim domain-containing protein [Pseudomonadales bacterium]